MAVDLHLNRRDFLGRAAMTIAATQFGPSCAEAKESREWAVFDGANEWINSSRLGAAQLQGKVVLVNFWTYTCINWLRTLPYVRAWSEKYKERLVVIGVHTPEFPFEHDLDNVRRSVRQMRIDYPIAVDNDYAIWRAFGNHYWPALYVLDPRGLIRHQHFGEGQYEQSERIIQRLLTAAGASTNPGLVQVNAVGAEAPADWNNLRSAENYLGHERTEHFASPGGVEVGRRREYLAPSRLALNQWALAGDWTIASQVIRSLTPSARIVNRFHARDLHLVMGPAKPGSVVRFRVAIDGQPPGPAHGADIDEAGNGIVAEQRLYQLIRQPAPIVDRQFEIEFLDAAVEAYAFTFG